MSIVQKLRDKKEEIKRSLLERIIQYNEQPLQRTFFIAISSYYLGNKREEELKAIAKKLNVKADEFVLWNFILGANGALIQDLMISYEVYHFVKDQPLSIQISALLPPLGKTIISYGWDLYRVSVRKKRIYPPIGYLTIIANARYLIQQYIKYGEKIGEIIDYALFRGYLQYTTMLLKAKERVMPLKISSERVSFERYASEDP